MRPNLEEVILCFCGCAIGIPLMGAYNLMIYLSSYIDSNDLNYVACHNIDQCNNDSMHSQQDSINQELVTAE